MKRYIMILATIALLASCSKDDNPMAGTSWLSTHSSECWWENSHLEGDYSEVLTFSDTEVQSKTLKNGYTYKNNWTKSYTYSDNKVNLEGGKTLYVDGNTLWDGGYIFYKQ